MKFKSANQRKAVMSKIKAMASEYGFTSKPIKTADDNKREKDAKQLLRAYETSYTNLDTSKYSKLSKVRLKELDKKVRATITDVDGMFRAKKIRIYLVDIGNIHRKERKKLFPTSRV